MRERDSTVQRWPDRVLTFCQEAVIDTTLSGSPAGQGRWEDRLTPTSPFSFQFLFDSCFLSTIPNQM